ncbi:MAG TPA: AI-2E family transporter, partial [Jiangellaceae bacterium]|nr:AI-2E family transporter [Jiangellaceae bacterium]
MRWFRRSKRRPGARTRQPATENAETGVLPGEPGGPALEPTRAHPPATPLHKLERGVDSLARWSLRLLIILVAVGVLGFAIGQAWTLVFPLILALILATILWPLAALLRRKLPAALASILTVVGFLAAIVGVFGYIIPTVADQASGMADQVMQGVQGLQERLAGPPFNLDSQRIGELLDSALQWLQDNSQQIASGVLSGVTGVGSALVAIILALVLTFFFLKDGPKFVPWMGRWVGEGMLTHAAELARRVWVTIGGFIWSQAAVALVDAVFIGLGLWLLDIPFALPIAVLIFFAAFIPIVGAVATGALAVVVALVTHDFTRA